MHSPLARDRRRPPGFIRPALPVLATTVPAGDGWLPELKHDGFRLVALGTATRAGCGVGTVGTGASSSPRGVAGVRRRRIFRHAHLLGCRIEALAGIGGLLHL